MRRSSSREEPLPTKMWVLLLELSRLKPREQRRSTTFHIGRVIGSPRILKRVICFARFVSCIVGEISMLEMLCQTRSRIVEYWREKLGSWLVAYWRSSWR